MADNRYDIVIAGAGPAGLSAAIYALRAGKSVMLLEAAQFGGQIVNTPEVENYPGIKHISGFDFAYGLYEQAMALGAQIAFERAESVEDLGDRKIVHGVKNDYEAGAVILATGAKNRPLGLEAEQRFIGHGISYCATCDGAFFRGRVVAVNGGGNTAIEDAAYLAGICEKVYLIHRREQFRGEERAVEALRGRGNVEFVLNATVTDLFPDEAGERLGAVEVTDKNSGETRRLDVACLFVAIGQIPENSGFADVARLDEKGYIAAGEDCLTGTPGVYTAGDCRTKTVRQLVTAASDGAVAALAAASMLDAK
ncbi:NAD(P)/FAD-dependent oxidoreductase [Lachnoclostridium sp. Marseille-P6806]|uniref:NAD(P)/FAD-dependent oxidoreductase n=1 Tax=Lachnoclostridium sp. Marseille-P6806 TaxID=2364793 RepID=UPI001030A0ED|nr:FAD-dependent oxidoreductase [Lachnoclostridium sp. Marseille-P6806]